MGSRTHRLPFAAPAGPPRHAGGSPPGRAQGGTTMTVLVGYLPTSVGEAAVAFGIEAARRRRETAGSELFASDAFVGLDVPLPGALDHLRGQRRRGHVAAAVPPGGGGGEPVAHVLLVEARLGAARLSGIGRPVTGGVRG